MDVLYFVFSNSQIDPLPSLEEEYIRLNDTLSPRAYRQDYYLKMDPFTTIERVCQNISQYRQRMFLFHYSGHADANNLLLQDEIAREGGLVQLLGNCPKLKLVFLNGCSTYGMVAALLEAGVKIVIATNAKVDDRTASILSISFYNALERGETLENAFELAQATVQTRNEIKIYRGPLANNPDEEGQWGQFFLPAQETIVQTTVLPRAIPIQQNNDFIPNEELLNALFSSLAEYNSAVKELSENEKMGEPVEEGDKQKEILNALPIPIAEHLRKLLCPVGSETDGFDRVSLRRLEQITTVFQMSMKLLTFTLIAQIWEFLLDESNEIEVLPTDLQKSLRTYFENSNSDRKSFDYIPFIRELRQYLDEKNIAYFIQELGGLAQKFYETADFGKACEYLSFVRRQIITNSINNIHIPDMCQRAEHSLSVFISQLGFLSNYTLASVKDIDIRKYRHQMKATYNHAVVKLMRVMGKLEVKQYVLDKFLDNRSVLLVKDQGMIYEPSKKQFRGTELSFLNLTPFVIDENAFIENTDISKLYFFEYLDAANNTYHYNYVKRPEEDSPLEVSAASKYEIVKEQFDVFRSQVLGNFSLNHL